jgi:hypothetical protein
MNQPQIKACKLRQILANNVEGAYGLRLRHAADDFIGATDVDCKTARVGSGNASVQTKKQRQKIELHSDPGKGRAAPVPRIRSSLFLGLTPELRIPKNHWKITIPARLASETSRG